MIEAVELETNDGVVLRGELRAGGDDWVVLAHAPARDLDMWSELVAELDEELTVVTVDLRGCGGSDGDAAPDRAGEDVEAMLRFARGRGADLLALVAAGEACAAALEVAGRLPLDGVILLGPAAAANDPGPTPRFVVAAAGDPEQVAAAEALQAAPGWSLVANVPIAESGAELVDGSWGSNVRAYVNGFVRNVRLNRVAQR
jgi:pimeloyl-ACP methyl ester carboxylesterase